jgi:hypothetical protein
MPRIATRGATSVGEDHLLIELIRSRRIAPYQQTPTVPRVSTTPTRWSRWQRPE